MKNQPIVAFLTILIFTISLASFDSLAIPMDVPEINTIRHQKKISPSISITSSSRIEVQWNRTFGGPYSDNAYSVVQMADGGFLLAGFKSFPPPWDIYFWDMWLVKTDSMGVEQWNQTYGTVFKDEAAFSVLQTTEGDFVLAGYTDSFGAGDYDMWLVKTDSMGIAQWNRTYGGSNHDYAKSLLQTADGGFLLAGFTNSHGAGDFDIWLVKTNSTGGVQWNRTYGGLNDEFADSLLQTADGGFLVVGETESYGAGGFDFWLMKINLTGAVLWNQTYGGSNSDEVSSLLQTADGGFLLVGETESYGVGSDDIWLVKTDSLGIMQWNRTYGGSHSDSANSLLQTADGGFLLAGYTESYGAGVGDIWLVKTDSLGVAQWHQTYGGPKRDCAFSIQQTADEGFVLAGFTNSNGDGSADMWLIKLHFPNDTSPVALTTTSESISGLATAESKAISGLTTLSLLVAFLVLGIWYKRKKS
ncbi:MAG: hypothetical protein ACFFB3_01155 [Candidatus Hodarchaeota archaeon]